MAAKLLAGALQCSEVVKNYGKGFRATINEQTPFAVFGMAHATCEPRVEVIAAAQRICRGIEVGPLGRTNRIDKVSLDTMLSLLATTQ